MKRVKYKTQLTFQQFYGFCQNLKPRVVRPGGGGSGGVASRTVIRLHVVLGFLAAVDVRHKVREPELRTRA